MDDLFAAAGLEEGAPRPLADRLRPSRIEEIVGQEAVLGPEGPLGRMLARGRLSSLILWGPPGVGKTTLARLLAARADLAFESLSAIFSGVADLKKAFERARERRSRGEGTLLFVDEIHRFNRAQQDGFLPVVEEGVVTLVGATTENPSFELNGALLSRCQVLVLERLGDEALEELLHRAERGEARPLPLTAEARSRLRSMADGDGRSLLNLAEQVWAGAGDAEERMDPATLGRILQRRVPLYDKGGEEHYNLISALHKSIRGSDPDAALYWLARMTEGGEDPLYLARRLVRIANEDIGLADPTAVHAALAARQVYEALGSPEGELALAQAVVHLAAAPKSIAVYRAWGAARAAARETGSLPPPLHLRNAPTSLLKEQGYGAGYEYDPDTPTGISGQRLFPEEMEARVFYHPTDHGRERAVRERLEASRARRRPEDGGGGG
jgi:putative ATPase